MKNLLLQPTSLALGALIALSLGAARPTPDSQAPPFQAGAQLYRVEFARPVSEILPGLGAATPVKVVEVRGSWVLLESAAIPRGPMWFNFDQVLRFSFER